jgi:tetratricopeptide (TPR) repeat protein
MVFGEIVRAHRLRLSLTQEELAARTGVGVRTVRDIEAGRIGRPRPGTVRLLAEGFALHGVDRDRFQQSALVLNGQPAITGGGESCHGGRLIPAQLPADVAGFTGRTDDLRRLKEIVVEAGESHQTFVVIAAVAGTAGVGKSALAVRCAHQVRDRFPDGQLYVNLRGYDRDLPVAAGEALAVFLRGLGVPADRIPLDVDERAARYRTELAGRRVLVVLDNAASVEQVRPLLPGTPTAAVLVTSRDALAGLVALHAAHRFDLDPLPLADAVTLLRRLAGEHVDADPDAAGALAEQCARLPLTLRVAAELAARRGQPLARLVAELADLRRRLDILDAPGDPRAAVRSVFSWSVRHLPPDTARMFRLLSLHPGPDLDPYAAAGLTNMPLTEARRAVDALARAHLVESRGSDRCGLHDLLRAYAADLVEREDPERDRQAAQRRLFHYYLAAAAAAMDCWYPVEAHRRPRVAAHESAVPSFTGGGDALAWLDSERAVLAATCAHAAGHDWPGQAIAMASIISRYLDLGGYHIDGEAVHGHARQAARQTGNAGDEATALHNLGVVYFRRGRYACAADHFQQALDLFRLTGDQVGQADALGNLGSVAWAHNVLAPATEYLQQAVDVYRLAGNPTGEAHALTALGRILNRQGQHKQAAERFGQALDLLQLTVNRTGEAHVLTGIGEVHAQQGRYEEAVRLFEHALDIHRQTGDRTGEAQALTGLADIRNRQGRHKQAAELFGKALDLFRLVGDRDGEAEALNGLGETGQADGDPRQALNQHAAALALAIEAGNRREQARAHNGLARTHRALGRINYSRSHQQQALDMYADGGAPDIQVRTRYAWLSFLRSSRHRFHLRARQSARVVAEGSGEE